MDTFRPFAVSQLGKLAELLAKLFPDAIVGYGRSWTGPWSDGDMSTPEVEYHLVLRVTRPDGEPLEIGFTALAIRSLKYATLETGIHLMVRTALVRTGARWIMTAEGDMLRLRRAVVTGLDLPLEEETVGAGRTDG